MGDVGEVLGSSCMYEIGTVAVGFTLAEETGKG